MKLVLTGATGFVGKQILEKAAAFDVTVIGRSKPESSKNFTFFQANIDAHSDYGPALTDSDFVIHSAARAHFIDDKSADRLTAFRAVNTLGTINLANQAARAGVKRFIFISSIKVNGEHTNSGKPFSPEDVRVPNDLYGLSKYEAEQGLLALAKGNGMEVVIIRPPLVYGPDVTANFASMMNWINKGVPLPLGSINNQRSFVALDNLVSFIIHCIGHPKAANEIFLISDGEDISTTDLLRKVGKAFDKAPRLIPIPVYLLTFAAKLIGKRDVAGRLFGSLQVDSSKARGLLGWKPVITMDQQLKKTMEAYLENEKTV